MKRKWEKTEVYGCRCTRRVNVNSKYHYCLKAAVWFDSSDGHARCAEHGPQSKPRSKHKPKPFARWSAKQCANAWLMFNGVEVAVVLRDADAEPMAHALNRHRVVLKEKP